MLAGWAACAPAASLTVSRVETIVTPPNPGLRLMPGLKAGDSLDSTALARAGRRITDQLADEGYISSTIEADTTVRGDSVAVRFQVSTGAPTRIGGWSVTGDSAVSSGTLLRSLPGRGSPFSRPVVDRAASSILSLYENSGYPFAIVTPLTVTQQRGFVYPVLQVAAGPRVEVSFLEFAGKPGTRPGLLDHIAGFSRGTYSSTTVALWQQRLEQSGLVVVDSQAIVRAAGAGPKWGDTATVTYGIKFWVTGSRVNTASGVAGYSPTDRKLTGLAQLSFSTSSTPDAGCRRAGSRPTAAPATV